MRPPAGSAPLTPSRTRCRGRRTPDRLLAGPSAAPSDDGAPVDPAHDAGPGTARPDTPLPATVVAITGFDSGHLPTFRYAEQPGARIRPTLPAATDVPARLDVALVTAIAAAQKVLGDLPQTTQGQLEWAFGADRVTASWRGGVRAWQLVGERLTVALRADDEIAPDGHVSVRWTAMAFQGADPTQRRTAARVVRNAFDAAARHRVVKPDRTSRQPFDASRLPHHDAEVPASSRALDPRANRALEVARTVVRQALPAAGRSPRRRARVGLRPGEHRSGVGVLPRRLATRDRRPGGLGAGHRGRLEQRRSRNPLGGSGRSAPVQRACRARSASRSPPEEHARPTGRPAPSPPWRRDCRCPRHPRRTSRTSRTGTDPAAPRRAPRRDR